MTTVILIAHHTSNINKFTVETTDRLHMAKNTKTIIALQKLAHEYYVYVFLHT